MIKLLFMGTPQFSATVLKGLLDNPAYEILGVVTQPDRAVGRKKDIKVTPVKQLALEHGISIYQPEKLSGSQELIEIMGLGADGIITAAFTNFYQQYYLIQFHLLLMYMHHCYLNIEVEHLSIMLL